MGLVIAFGSKVEIFTSVGIGEEEITGEKVGCIVDLGVGIIVDFRVGFGITGLGVIGVLYVGAD